jgi:hypothetical protein
MAIVSFKKGYKKVQLTNFLPFTFSCIAVQNIA